MTVRRVEIGSFDELADMLEGLARDWDDIAVDALKGAIIDGGYLSELNVRIPKSEYARYAAKLWGTDRYGVSRRVDLIVKRQGNADGTGWKYSLPRNWRKTYGVDRAEADHVREQYGHGRLLKSDGPRLSPGLRREDVRGHTPPRGRVLAPRCRARMVDAQDG